MYSKYIDVIREKGMTGELLRDIIAKHSQKAKKMQDLYERYKNEEEAIPIKARSAIKYNELKQDGISRLDDKVNNRLNNPFDVDIVDTKVGYLFGNPITYGYDDKLSENKNSEHKTLLERFTIRNHVEDEDSELGKMATICGYGARLCYVDRSGMERVKNIDEPWQVIFIGEDIQEPEYSIYVYKDYEGADIAEFYDDVGYTIFKADTDGAFREVEQEEHVFSTNPLFGLPNNKELMGDVERVLALIDAYDRTLSDASNEIEQYRLAYLILRGVGADEETLRQLKKSGVLELLDKEDSADYLTKDINNDLIEDHLDRLEKNIIRLAKSANFSDEAFGTAISGVAMRFKLMSLENKCITMERKFTAMLRYQFKVLFSAWQKRYQISEDDYLNVWFAFKRNLPVNVLEEAQIATTLGAPVSDRTKLSLLSFVDNPEFELIEWQKDLTRMDASMDPLGGEDDESTRNRRASGQTAESD